MSILYNKISNFLRLNDSLIPSVLWRCWLGVRKSIWYVKIEWWGVDVVTCLEQGADCSHTVQLMPMHPKTPLSLAPFKSRLAFPFWFRFSQVFLEKRPLNDGCSSNSKWQFNCSYNYILSSTSHFAISNIFCSYTRKATGNKSGTAHPNTTF